MNGILIGITDVGNVGGFMVNKNQNKIFKFIFFTAFLIYLAYLAYLTLFSHFYGRSYFHRSINLVPFRTITHFVMNEGSTRIMLTNLGGNMAAFVPMGFLPPFFSIKLKRARNIFMLILAASLLIEILQFCAGVGVSDIDDILLNTLGGILGYLIHYIFEGRRNTYVKRKDN